MSQKNSLKIKCDNCGIEIIRKQSRIKKSIMHYCSHKCRYAGRTSDIDLLKDKIIKLYNTGLTALEISKELGLESPRLYYHLKKWKLGIKKCYAYNRIMQNIGQKRKERTEKDFMQRYKDGKISWRQTHKIAQRIWNITEKPCEVCGWNEAERDMHLIIKRLLKKNNAVSLCPNCHRLFHRDKIKLSRKKGKLVIVKI